MKKLLVTSSVLAVVTGVVLVAGGVGGIAFTYNKISQENITTPTDSAIPGVPVRGPISLKTQADIMRVHVLKMTGGKTYAEMPRQIAKLDEAGKPVLDSAGKEVMVANTARDIWVTYTALTTALNLGLLTYAFSTFTLVMGILSLWGSVVLYTMSKKLKV